MVLSFRSLLAVCGVLSTAFAHPYYQVAPRASSLTLPSSDLPPPTNLTLKVVALGVGHQNYTCSNATGTYGTNVALASLFDATSYLTNHQDQIAKLPAQRLSQYLYDESSPEAVDYNPYLERIGEHYFEPTTPATPVFDLYKLNLFLGAKKAASVPAPNTAKDINWVYLQDNGKGETHGLKAAYRVETAGGQPPASCSGDSKISVPYVAEYWFYN